MTLATKDRQPAPVATYRWTIDRYHRAVRTGIFDGQSLELLNGELIQMFPESISHAGLSGDGADYLREHLGCCKSACARNNFSKQLRTSVGVG